MLIAVSTEAPETPIPHDELATSSKTEVNAVHYKESEDRMTQLSNTKSGHGKWEEKYARLAKKVQIDNKFHGYNDKFLNTMKEFETM